jgi:hypothetical protein
MPLLCSAWQYCQGPICPQDCAFGRESLLLASCDSFRVGWGVMRRVLLVDQDTDHTEGGARSVVTKRYGVLIFDPSAEHAGTIMTELQSANVTAIAFQTKQQVFEFVGVRQIDMAVIVIYSKAWWRDELRLFCNSIRYLQKTAEIICVLNWPEECSLDRIYGDTLDVTVLHGA